MNYSELTIGQHLSRLPAPWFSAVLDGLEDRFQGERYFLRVTDERHYFNSYIDWSDIGERAQELRYGTFVNYDHFAQLNSLWERRKSIARAWSSFPSSLGDVSSFVPPETKTDVLHIVDNLPETLDSYPSMNSTTLFHMRRDWAAIIYSNEDDLIPREVWERIQIRYARLLKTMNLVPIEKDTKRRGFDQYFAAR